VVFNNKSKFSFWAGLFLLFIGLTLIFLSLNVYIPSIVPEKFKILTLTERKTILFLGVDEVLQDNKPAKASNDLLWRGRSDTIILLSIDPGKNRINVLNIPRDTRIKIDGYDIEKINYLNAIDGPKLTKKYVEKLIGVKVDHYIEINLEGASQFIDEIGGIVLKVPHRMQYTDVAGMLDINLHPGIQLLNGKQAVEYLRFRHDNLGDIGRVKRQQEFIKALFKKALDPVVFVKAPILINSFNEAILTDLKPGEIIKIASFIRNVPASKRKIAILPGTFGELNGVSFWIPTKKETKEIVKEFFYD